MANQGSTGREYYARTVHDEREYIIVTEVFYYDKNGEDVIDEDATRACFGQVTCGDGTNRYDVLKDQVEACLEAKGIKYLSVDMENGF